MGQKHSVSLVATRESGEMHDFPLVMGRSDSGLTGIGDLKKRLTWC